jgi:hypothetical protein
MKKYSGRAADPFDGPQLAAVANPTVWALAVRWGSTIHAVPGAVPAFDRSQLVVPVPRVES